MTNRKLGEMSTDELIHDRAWEQAERIERYEAHTKGSPGKHAALSREQVKAFLGPLLEREWENGDTAFDGVYACARALLNLAPDAKSPLED